jgi:hypothetical protein
VCLVSVQLILSGSALAQNEEAFAVEVNKTIHQLPSVWQTEVADAVAQTWSPETLTCIRNVDIVVSEGDDPLAVKYDDNRIIISRGYVETLGQATLFTFMTTLGAFPLRDIPSILDQHELMLAKRRLDNIAYFGSRAEKPPLFLDYSYALPYQGRLSDAFARIGVQEARHAADMLNGAVLIFALLHEAGHHVYHHCPSTVEIGSDLTEEVWADYFAIKSFQNEDFPTLLAVDAIRILTAYKVADDSTRKDSLRCPDLLP